MRVLALVSFMFALCVAFPVQAKQYGTWKCPMECRIINSEIPSKLYAGDLQLDLRFSMEISGWDDMEPTATDFGKLKDMERECNFRYQSALTEIELASPFFAKDSVLHGAFSSRTSYDLYTQLKEQEVTDMKALRKGGPPRGVTVFVKGPCTFSRPRHWDVPFFRH